MNKAIVVGGAGFVGSMVVRELLDNHVQVTVVVRPGYRDAKQNNHRLEGLDIKIIECDIKNINKLKLSVNEYGFDVFYHFAWDGLSGDKLLDYTTQIMNIKWIVDAVITASELGCKKFIGAGSITQYEIQQGKANNIDKTKYYKIAKLACEYMGRTIAFDNKIKFFWPIITNIYGENEVSPRLINSLIRKLLSGEKPALSEGNQIYDFIHVSDAARVFYLIAEKGIENETYVIGSGKAKPLKEFLLALRDIVNPNSELGFGESPFNGIYLPKEAYDISVLQRDTGFEVQIPFEEGIKRTILSYKQRIG
jgi:nucleoside-diphosphate-sugar epimerase